MDKLRMETQDLAQMNIDKIGEMFPNVITETRGEDGKLKKAVNFELLKQLLYDEVLSGDEAYEFTWVGKKASIVEANKPIRKTLRPCKEESKNWDTTENLYIEGDNLEVLKLLQESYLGKVKMIYIDPPYNTGNDFIYQDDFTTTREDWSKESGERSEDGDRLFRNTESNGRFHSDWCSMIYPRLTLARNLLQDDGVIYISIDDVEVAQLRKICDEVFGQGNFLAEFIWKSKPQGGNDNTHIVSEHEYILCYAKNSSAVSLKGREKSDSKYNLHDEYYDVRGGYSLTKLDLSTLEYRVNLDYPVIAPDGTIIFAGGATAEQQKQRELMNTRATRDWQWRWSQERLLSAFENGYAIFKQQQGIWHVYTKEYENVDKDGNVIVRERKHRTTIDFTTNINGTREIEELIGRRAFSFPKPTDLIKYFVNMASGNEGIVLDFFSGSATTAHATMQLNANDSGKRKFIMVQLSEVCADGTEAFKAGYSTICEIGKERIRRAGDKIKADLLKDAEEEQTIDNIEKHFQLTLEEDHGKKALSQKEIAENLDIGFRVLKLADTNMKDVYYSADEYNQGMLANLESNIKEDRTDLDLLFGCLLDWGLSLSMPYTSETIENCAVHTYNNGDLIACFDNDVPESVIREIAKRQPLRAVFRDSSFTSSPEKINVEEIFKLLSPNTTVKVI